MGTTWYAQSSSSNIDAVNLWNSAAGGGGSWLTWPPAADDILRANGKTGLVINVDFTCLQIDTLTSGGRFDAATTRTITCNVVGGTTVCLSITTAAITVTLNGNVTGSNTTATSAITAYAAFTLNVNGNVTAGTRGKGISATSPAVVIVGNVAGGAVGYDTAVGVDLRGTGSVTITGNVTGGATNSSYGVWVGGTGSLSLTGDVTGGTNATAVGLYLDSTAGPFTVNGNVAGGTAGAGIYSRNVAVTVVGGNLIENGGGCLARKRPGGRRKLL